MSQFAFDIPDDLLSGLDELFDDAAPKMIEAAMPEYKKAMENSIKMSISNAPEDVARQTGELVKSVKVNGPNKTKDGGYIGNLTFNGRDSKGSPNVVKAFALEYGNNHQQARPFLQRADNSSRSKVLKKMQDVFEEVVGK